MRYLSVNQIDIIVSLYLNYVFWLFFNYGTIIRIFYRLNNLKECINEFEKNSKFDRIQKDYTVQARFFF